MVVKPIRSSDCLRFVAGGGAMSIWLIGKATDLRSQCWVPVTLSLIQDFNHHHPEALADLPDAVHTERVTVRVSHVSAAPFWCYGSLFLVPVFSLPEITRLQLPVGLISQAQCILISLSYFLDCLLPLLCSFMFVTLCSCSCV